MAWIRACSASRRGLELESRWLALAAEGRDGRTGSYWKSLGRMEEGSRVESPKQFVSMVADSATQYSADLQTASWRAAWAVAGLARGSSWYEDAGVNNQYANRDGSGRETKEKRSYKARWTQPRSARVRLYKNNDVSALELLSIFRWNSRKARLPNLLFLIETAGKRSKPRSGTRPGMHYQRCDRMVKLYQRSEVPGHCPYT